MSDEIKLGDIVVFKTGNRAFEVIGKYIVPDDRLWRVDAITENDPPTPDRNRKYRLVAVDCPNVMLDEIPEIYVESYSEKLERELEEQRKEALKMKRNEIKQGDKVRIANNAPEEFERFKGDDMNYEVVRINPSKVIIQHKLAAGLYGFTLSVPTKYLVKVDAEAKEAKYRKGDRIKFKNIYELQKVKDKSFRWMLVMFASKEATITAVEDNGFYRVDIDPSIGGINDDMIECKVKPTEQTEVEKSFEDQLRDVLNGVEHQDYGHPIQAAMISLDINYWDAYAADLAKEIVLKTVNSASDRRPSAIAEYATDIAKAAVEGLKRK